MVYNHCIYKNKDPETKEHYPYIAKMPADITKTKSDYTWYIPSKTKWLALLIKKNTSEYVHGTTNAPKTNEHLLQAFRRSLEYWMEKAAIYCRKF